MSLTVAYHSACSLQHGQKVIREPKDLLSKFGIRRQRRAGRSFVLWLGGTTTFSSRRWLDKLRARKVANIERLETDMISAGNIGCVTSLRPARDPVVHTIELLDWATGGPMPEQLRRLPDRPKINAGAAPAAQPIASMAPSRIHGTQETDGLQGWNCSNFTNKR